MAVEQTSLKQALCVVQSASSLLDVLSRDKLVLGKLEVCQQTCILVFLKQEAPSREVFTVL